MCKLLAHPLPKFCRSNCRNWLGTDKTLNLWMAISLLWVKNVWCFLFTMASLPQDQHIMKELWKSSLFSTHTHTKNHFFFFFRITSSILRLRWCHFFKCLQYLAFCKPNFPRCIGIVCFFFFFFFFFFVFFLLFFSSYTALPSSANSINFAKNYERQFDVRSWWL